MKVPLSMLPSSRCIPAAPTKFILTGLVAVSATLALGASAAAQGPVVNPVSNFFHTTDGHFSNGVGVGEWSDVTPAWFISTGVGTAIPTTPGNPAANSLLFAGLGRTSPVSDISLFLLYDFLPRTPGSPVGPGEIFASITFPITFDQAERTVSVLFQGRAAASGELGEGAAPSFFDVFVDLNLDGSPDVPAAQLGIIGAAGFGPSPLSSLAHLIVELDVPLRIPAGFASPGSPLPGNGINPATGLYDPDPAFWGAAASPNGGGTVPSEGEGEVAADGAGLQPASAALFTINPDGSTFVQPVPEPSSAALFAAALGLLGRRRRKR